MVFQRKQAKQQAYVDSNCHPLKPIVLSTFQIPLWITSSFTMRAMLAKDYLSEALQSGGILWFIDLSMPDPYYIIPLLFFLGNTINHELNYSKTPSPTRIHKIIRVVAHLSSVFLLMASSMIPVMLSLYWCTSTWCHLANNLLLINPRVRRMLKIRKLDTEIQQPYRRIWDNLSKWRS